MVNMYLDTDVHKHTSYKRDISFDDVFTFKNMYKSYKNCIKGVSWKASTQKYIMYSATNIHNTLDKLRKGTYKSKGFCEFDICERGKKRHIRSVLIEERVVQRCLCDYCLNPLLERTLIYDNGASMKGKGYSFTVKRLDKKLRTFLRHYTDGYILVFDYSKFFDSISHKLVYEILEKHLKDERLLKLTKHFVDNFGDVGLGLGSQISQILALASVNNIDHLMPKGYGRYMDDGYIIFSSKEELSKYLNVIKTESNKVGLKLNEKKTQIIKLSHGFTFMKIKYYITPTKKIIKRISRKSVVRERKRIKALERKYKAGEITLSNCMMNISSWFAYAKQFNSRRTIYSMVELVAKTFKVRKSYVFKNCVK